jgi:serine/threonine protein kinase
MLYQMMVYTGEAFRAEQLQASPRAPEYFDTNCKDSPSCDILVDVHLPIPSGQLKKNPEIFNWPINTRIAELKVVSDDEATATASLMERCLHLNPTHRSTAAELLSDGWFNGVD